MSGKAFIKLEENELKKLQREVFILLQEFDRICKKNKIPYFLSHGTLLGAIRHGGFIPWDDDIDVQMLRSDYNKFIEVSKNELDEEKFLMQTQETDEHYNWVYGKLKLKNTSYTRMGQEHLSQKNGIFMDIFPLDCVTENRFKRKLVSTVCKICRKVLWSQVGKKHATTNFLKTVYFIASYIPRSAVIRINDYFAQKYNKGDSSLLICHNLKGEVFEKRLYSESMEVNFENMNFNAPKGYHGILTKLYGDYMILPPPEKRQGHCYATYIQFLDGVEIKL